MSLSTYLHWEGGQHAQLGVGLGVAVTLPAWFTSRGVLPDLSLAIISALALICVQPNIEVCESLKDPTVAHDSPSRSTHSPRSGRRLPGCMPLQHAVKSTHAERKQQHSVNPSSPMQQQHRERSLSPVPQRHSLSLLRELPCGCLLGHHVAKHQRVAVMEHYPSITHILRIIAFCAIDMKL